MNRCTITYPAEVISITEREIEVKVLVHSACSGCHAKGHCSMADQEERIVQVPYSEGLAVGDRVTLKMAQNSGFLAVFLGYVLPLIILVVAIFSTGQFVREEFAALIGIGGVALYYLILWFHRGRFKEIFQIQVNGKGDV